MPTKEQLTKELSDFQSVNRALRQEIADNALTDGEAKALDKVVQALQELERSDSQRRTDSFSSTGIITFTSPLSRVLNAAAARFGVTLDYQMLTETVDKLLAADNSQAELEEMKRRQSAVEQIMYPERLG